MSESIDSPKDVRAGEEVDAERLAVFLREHVAELRDAPSITIQQFPSGHSNLTYSVDAGERHYVLRRPPFGSKVKSAHDMGREYRVLSKLHPVYPLAPEPIVYCEDEGVIGAKFYLMRRLTGVIIRRQIPVELGLVPERLRRLDLALVDNFARIHAVDYAAAGLSDLGKPDGYVERQVNGWIKRYHDSQTDEVPMFDRIAVWLGENMPKTSTAALIHNDYKLDNVVLDADDPTKIIGVLDWEMATLGDPLMDLGTAISYWVEEGDSDEIKMMRYAPTTEPGSITRQEFLARYEEAAQRKVENALFYFVFGCMKNAAVIQQIYYRYKQGLTKDERFAMFIAGVHIACNHAARRLDAGGV
jgi:aminoglycoside phosphotransferase (APT) family kinase protein